jgi:glutamate-ammonia-ligase adenylyltransferase
VADLLKVARRTVPQYKMTSVGAFRSLYDRLTDGVREIYERVLEVEVAPASPASPLGPWSLPEAQQDAGALRQKVAQYGFQNVGAALRVIEMMSRGPGLASQPAELVGPLLPQILEACYASGDPDQALGNFERFSFLCGPKDIFYLTLRDNPSLIRTLGLLGGRSQFLSDVLTQNPQFLDILLDRGFLRRPSEKGELLSELSERLGKAESLEASLNLLRRYKQRELLRIGIRDLEGMADWQGVGQEISDLAEVSVETALRLTLAHAYEGQEPPRLAVFGLGKLGGRELHYASDLDLLLVSEGWGGAAEQQRQERVAEEIIGALSRVTEEGAAFKVDLRLRPEGKAGALIRSLEGYADYFEGRLETWQRQALIRARPVAGDAGLASRFSALLEKAVFGADFGAVAMEEIVAMRERIQRQRQSRVGGSPLDIKNGRGGIVELEFLVQLLQLAYGGSHSSLRTPYTARAIEALAAAGVVSDEQAGSLLGTLGFLKKLENQLQMAKQRPSSALPASSTRQTVLAHQLGYSDQAPLPARELFLRDLQHATNAVREMWDSAVSSLRHRFESRGNER